MGKAIEDYEREGWSLHTYQATGPYMGEINHHYLLFEREKGKKTPSSVKAAAAAATKCALI